MIADALVFLRNRLNQHFRSFSADPAASEDKVVFLDGDQKTDSISFKPDTVTVMLYRVERETACQPGNGYLRRLPGQPAQQVKPDLSVHLHLLFVVKFKDYAQGLRYLSQVISYFQSNCVFERQSAPDLGDEIAELALDMVPLTVQQENELWGLLRTFYLPSVAYRVRTLVFMDQAAQPAATPVASIDRQGLT